MSAASGGGFVQQHRIECNRPQPDSTLGEKCSASLRRGTQNWHGTFNRGFESRDVNELIDVHHGVTETNQLLIRTVGERTWAIIIAWTQCACHVLNFRRRRKASERTLKNCGNL